MTATGTLARYISLRLLFNIAAVYAIFALLIFLVDFVELLRISSKSGGVGTAHLAYLTILRVPSILEITLPLCVMAGTIYTYMNLSRSSELVIMRASGMSVWQFLFPAVAIAGLIGAVTLALYNPLAAAAKAQSDVVYAEIFKKSRSLLKTKGAGAWLAQDSIDGRSIINAKHSAQQGMHLTGVTIFQYGKDNILVERIEADSATLKDGRWELTNAQISSPKRKPEQYDTYLLGTYLTPTEVKDALGSVESISFWDLPKFINVAEKAGLSATRYKVQYQELLSLPLLLMTMVLLAATCSLRPFRFGKIQTLMIGGAATGFAFFVFSEVSKNLGLSGLVSPNAAAWVPIVILCLLTLSVLMRQEDG